MLNELNRFLLIMDHWIVIQKIESREKKEMNLKSIGAKKNILYCDFALMCIHITNKHCLSIMCTNKFY
jgi:hypothetical protein